MKALTITCTFLLCAILLIAQPPQAFKYQAVVRDAAGEVLQSQAVGIRISIHDATAGGTIVYQETFSDTTNQFGLVNLKIGNGSPTIGSFEGIDWSTCRKFLEIETDPAGGTNYISMGTSKLLSVPYAIYSGATGDTSTWQKNAPDIYYNRGNVGIGTTSPDASSVLELNSNTKGLLPPRMTNAERNAISSPAEGLVIYNTTTKCLDFYTGWFWIEICDNAGTPVADYNIGTGGSCANTTVSGIYEERGALNTSNTLTLDAVVTETGTWSITTNTLNGYSFSGSGFFDTTGTVQVKLEGTGTPVTAQTDNFTATANGTGGICTFSVTVLPYCGIPFSYGGQSYNTIQIGTQCWMAENLNIGSMINGNISQTDNVIIEKYCYGNSTSNCDTYGGLYQWNEMMNYNINIVQGICPAGWHLPTDAEWCILEQELDATITCSSTGLRGIDAGGKLKESGTIHWDPPNTGATNSSGFTGLPGGVRPYNNSTFENLHAKGYFWSSNESGSSAWCRKLFSDVAQVIRHNNYKDYGFSVRCIKGELPNQAPEATNVSFYGTAIAVGETLTGNYVYSDINNDPEGTSIYQWYHADDASGSNQVAISGAVELSYTLQATDENKFISFEVTPVAQTGVSPGTTVMSSFQGSVNPYCGEPISDLDGNIYNTVQIGTQCWMAENLNIGTMIYGNINQTDNGTIEKYCYDNNTSNCNIYGGLYQWNEIMQYSVVYGTQGICPTGWHIPTDAGWCTMEQEVDPTITCSSTGPRGVDGGGKLKEAGTIHWNPPNTGATNSSGFTGLPGGLRPYNNASFVNIQVKGYFWSSTESGSSAWCRKLFSDAAQVIRATNFKDYGFSVRCVKGVLPNQAPEATNVSFYGTAIAVGETLTGNYVYSDINNDPEGTSIYQWYHADDASGSNQVAISGAVELSYTLQATDENKFISFEVTPVAQTGVSPGTTVMSSFQGSVNPYCGEPISDLDGNIYNTVQIGTQCWMAENLNIGTMIYGNINQTDNGTIEKYCYDNNTSNCNIYGGLYQWNEIMQYSVVYGTQGICPTGWHIPTDAGWCTMEQEVDPTITCSSTGPRGVDGGGKLKEAGTIHWNPPNTGATNSSGFTGLPGGLRPYNNASFVNIQVKGYFWSSTESGSSAWCRKLFSDAAQVIRATNFKDYGFSVRCVKGVLPNQAPEATNVSFSGNMMAGDMLTGSYTYVDNNNDPEGTSIYQWYRADDHLGSNQEAINGASAITYTMQAPADVGKFISFEVIPVAQTGTSPGAPVMSAFLGPGAYVCGRPVTDIDGHVYNSVQIGFQCWMAENLNTGSRIHKDADQTDNGIIEKYCYNNDTSYCDTYGGLYQWNEMMQYITTPGTQGICPTGWHIPTDSEWCVLENWVDTYTVSCSSSMEWRGFDAGDNLKSTNGWYSNGNGTDLYGFTALPAGYRDTHGSTSYVTEDAHFWNSSSQGEYGWKRALSHNTPKIYRYNGQPKFGFSVRCLMDE